MSDNKRGLGFDIGLGNLGNTFGGNIDDILEQAELLAQASGNEEAKERVRQIRERMGKQEDDGAAQSSARGAGGII